MRGGILLAVAIGGLALTAWHVVPQPDTPSVIGRVDVQGVERLTPGDVRRASGLNVGMPWTAQARRQAIDDLIRLPQVQTAEIHEVTPSSQSDVRVRIEVVERRPYGIVELEGQGPRWVDRDGVLLEPVDRQSPLLPTVSGFDVEDAPEGSRLGSKTGVRVMRSFYALSGDTLRQFSSMRFRGYDVVLSAHEGWRALLPPERLHEQVQRLERVVTTLRAQGESGWRTLDLRVPDEVVIGR